MIRSPLIFFPYAPGCSSAMICPLSICNPNFFLKQIICSPDSFLNRDLPTFYMQPGFFLQANHMQLGFLLKVVICPLSICSPDSFLKQIICSPDFFLKPWSTHFLYATRIPSKFSYLAVISSPWWLQVSCKIKNKVEIRNHVIGNRIKSNRKSNHIATKIQNVNSWN